MSNIGIKQGGDSSIDRMVSAMKETATEKALEMNVEQQEAKQDVQEYLKELSNPFAKQKTDRKKLENRNVRVSKLSESAEKTKDAEMGEQLDQKSQEYEARNPELKSKVLLLLREYIKPDDTAEDILKKMGEFYEDVSLADEALDFLLDTTKGELHNQVKNAQENLRAQNEREIIAGRNIGKTAREAASDALGTPTSLRDLYRDLTGNPRDANALFQELSSKYAFKDLNKVSDFLLHSLGADLRSKGPSIPRGLLHNILQETRALQAILGVYSFFRGRMPLLRGLFEKNGIPMPDEMTFEALAKLFMTFTGDRYLSQDKILSSAGRLGIEKWVLAKIIAFSALRDAIREVSMNQIFRSVQHRDEVYAAIIQALEALEEELEALLEEQEDEDEDDDEDSDIEEEEDK